MQWGLILILSYQVIFESFGKSILKIVFPGIIKDIVIRLLYTLFVVLFFYELITFSQLINSLLVIYGIALIALIIYVTRKAGLRLTGKFQYLDKSQFMSIINYSLFALLGASGTYIILNIDQLMISNQVGLKGNGIYTTAFFIAVVIEMPRRAMANITTPLVSQFFKKGEIDQINQLYQKVSINQMVVGSLLLVGILVNLNNVFDMMPNSDVYRAGLNVVFIIGLAKMVDMTFGINGEIILMSKYYRYNVLFTVILGVVAVLTNWVLIRAYGIDGAALATGATLVVFNLIKLIFLKVKLNLWPFTKMNLLVLIIGVLTYFVVNQIPVLPNYMVDLLVRSVITSALFLGPCVVLKVSPDMNQILYQFTGLKFLVK